MTEVSIATITDAPEILQIYSPYILYSASTFETELPSIEEFQKRIEAGLQKFPWIVCHINNSVAAYVYASSHREREAYQWTCECSVYVHDYYKGNGIGKELYSVLFQLLKMQGMRNVYAGISLPNDASAKLHEKCGFENFAVYKSIGYKLNAWHNVGWWKLQLNEYELKPPPPLKFSELDPLQFHELFSIAAQKIHSKIIG